MKLAPAIANAPVVFLMGAGASVALGKRTTAEFWQHFSQSTLRTAADADQRAMDEFVTALIVGASGEHEDIERVLSLLESNVASLAALSAQDDFTRRVLHGSTAQVEGFKRLSERVRDLIYDEVIDHYSEIDRNEARDLYRPLLQDFYLWMAGIPNATRTVPVFTLNYDLAIEVAASSLQLALIDGLHEHVGTADRRWDRRQFETYEPRPDENTVVLVKLHGSVRWGFDKGRRREGSIVELPAGVGRDPGRFAHAVLYPSRAPKPTDIEPFRTGYRILDRCLESASLLVVIGCSLRDPEIRTVIADAMDDNQDLRILVVSPAADHSDCASLLGIEPDRIVGVQHEFRILPYVQGQGGLMPCFRGYAMAASGDEMSGQAFKFGRTVDWLVPAGIEIKRPPMLEEP